MARYPVAEWAWVWDDMHTTEGLIIDARRDLRGPRPDATEKPNGPAVAGGSNGGRFARRPDRRLVFRGTTNPDRVESPRLRRVTPSAVVRRCAGGARFWLCVLWFSGCGVGETDREPPSDARAPFQIAPLGSPQERGTEPTVRVGRFRDVHAEAQLHHVYEFTRMANKGGPC